MVVVSCVKFIVDYDSEVFLVSPFHHAQILTFYCCFDILMSRSLHFCSRFNAWHLSNYLFTEVQLFGVHGTANDLAKLTIPKFSPKLSFLSKLQGDSEKVSPLTYKPDCFRLTHRRTSPDTAFERATNFLSNRHSYIRFRSQMSSSPFAK